MRKVLIATNYSDETRMQMATLAPSGKRMLGPAELQRCEHGKFESYRWTWPVGETPECGAPEMLANGCEKCAE